MQLLTELAPYYLRKRQIEFEVKLLLSEIATVTCSILDSSGNDITHDEGVLYSKMNILDVKRAYNSDVCKLYVSFQRAKYFVTVKMTAKDIHQNIVDSKCCSFRVYSEEPKLKPEADATTTATPTGTTTTMLAANLKPRKRPRIDTANAHISTSEPWLNLNYSLDSQIFCNSPGRNDSNRAKDVEDKTVRPSSGLNDIDFNLDFFMENGVNSPFEYENRSIMYNSNSIAGHSAGGQPVREKYIGVPRLPRPMVQSLHKQEIDRIIKSLLETLSDNLDDKANNTSFGIGVTGMPGVGKTTVLAAVCRASGISEKFKTIYWVSSPSKNNRHHGDQLKPVDTMYQLLVELGRKNNINVENPYRSCQRAMEKIILLSGDSVLMAFDNVESVQQIRAIYTEINRSKSSRMIIGTSNCGIVAQLSLQHISLQIPSREEALFFLKAINTTVLSTIMVNNSSNYDATTDRAVSVEHEVEEDQHMAAVTAAVGRLPLGMEVAARCKTFVFGYKEIASMLKSDEIFFKTGCLASFSLTLEQKIRMLDRNTSLALLSLATITRHNSKIHYQEPYYLIPVNLLAHLWNVGEIQMKNIFQLLLNDGFVGYTAVTASNNNNNKKNDKAGNGTKTSSYLRVHILVVRYLQLIVKVINADKFTDVESNSIALPISSSRLLDCHNGSNVMTAYKEMKPKGTTSNQSAFSGKLFQKISILDLYLYVDSSDLKVYYSLLFDVALHQNPWKEFYRRRDEVPEQIQALSSERSKINNKLVRGLGNAIKYIKNKIDEERRILLDAGMEKEVARKWNLNTVILDHLNKTVDDVIEAMLLRICKKCDWEKPKEERVYDVSTCLRWLTLLFECTHDFIQGSLLCTVEDCVQTEKLLAFVRSPDGSEIFSAAKFHTPLEDGCDNSRMNREIFLQASLIQAYAQLFTQAQYIKMGKLQSLFVEVDLANKMVDLCGKLGIKMHDIVRMDVLMMGVYTSVNTTVYIFPGKGAAEAVFYDGLALQFNTVLEDVCVKIIHSKQEWARLCKKSEAYTNDSSRLRYWSQFNLPKRVNAKK